MALNSSGSIFDVPAKRPEQPLAARLRPTRISEVIGHQQYLGEGGLIGAMVQLKRLSSILLSGAPGVGKTTIAQVVASEAGYKFLPFVATSLGVKEIKEAQVGALNALQVMGTRTVLFVDEVHRLTKVQSDALLQPVEEGVFTLIAATTENPWMEVSPALLSRFLVVELSVLGREAVAEVLERAQQETGCVLKSAGAELIYELCGGDLRSSINVFEAAMTLAKIRARGGQVEISEEDVRSVKRTVSNGLSRSEHYEMTSALIKSMRGSDVNAALYWLARLLVSGEDPRFIARRLLIFASEDVGLADAEAVSIAHATMHAAETIGMPEVRISLGHCVSYLSMAPKSRASYDAIDKALKLAGKTLGWSVPQHLRGVVSEIEVSRGKTQSDADPQSGFPKGLAEVEFFKPGDRN